jgi:hypothetical protein
MKRSLLAAKPITHRELPHLARVWRDGMTQSPLAGTKQEFSQRIRPDNTSGCPGVYLKRQIIRRGDWSGEYVFWQAQTPQGVKPFRSRSFSVDRYDFDGAYELAAQARTEFVSEVEGCAGVTLIPSQLLPGDWGHWATQSPECGADGEPMPPWSGGRAGTETMCSHDRPRSTKDMTVSWSTKSVSHESRARSAG